MQDMVGILKNFQNQKILVAGDLMLDRFVYGDVDRISPESPVPVLSITHEDIMLGGAGNVLANLHALGCIAVPFAVVGSDDSAKEIKKILGSFEYNLDGILTDETRPTTIKTRYVARHQQLLRSDLEKTHPISSGIEKDIVKKVTDIIADVKCVVLSDYGKGFLTKSLVAAIISAAKKYKVPVLVDPKGYDYSIYMGADIVTPNRKELSLASGVSNLKLDKDIEGAAKKIISSCGISHVVATRSEDGLSVISKDAPALHLPTKAQEVFDVSGAGDAVIATLAACLCAGASINDAASLANLAGGIAVSKSGTAPVRYEELKQSITRGTDTSGHAAMVTDTFDAAAEKIRTWQAMGLRVGLTNGCFDIVHAGHVRYINQARAQCDRLVLALNHDDSIRILKGPTRPVNDQAARATVIGGLSAVDLVVFFGARTKTEDNTPCALIERCKPDIYFKGGDYTVEQLPEAKIVTGYGGRVAIMAMHEGFSTTSIIEKSKKSG